MNPNQGAAPAGAIQLGQHQAGDLRGGAELFRLPDGVLAGVGVQHQQHLVGRAAVGLLQHFGDLAQFVHQRGLGVLAAGGVGQHEFDIAGLGGGHRVKDHAAGVGAGLGVDEFGPAALAPQLQLVNGGGAEGVAGGQQHLAALPHQARGQLADGGGFAHPVHAHKEVDRGVDDVTIEGGFRLLVKSAPDGLLQAVLDAGGVGDALRADGLA